MPVRFLLAILLVLPLPLVPAEAPAPASGQPPVATPAPATQSAPIFSDAEWQRAQGGSAPAAPGEGVVGKAALGLVISLVAIALVAGGLAYALRRFGMRRVLPGRGRHLTVIETVPLGFKRSISLLRIGDQLLVVGQGEHDLNHLATLPASVLDPAAPAPTGDAGAPAAPAAPTPAAPPSAFRAVLDSLSGRRS
jgi:flagellar biosynthetic protein FliO